MTLKPWLAVLLAASLLLLSLPALADEPAGSPGSETLPMARPLEEDRPRLPDEQPILELSIKGENPSAPVAEPEPMAAPAGILLSEGFEGGVVPPPGDWSVVKSHPSRNWTVVDRATYPSMVYSGDYAAWVNYDTASASDEWLYTPAIDLTGSPDASLQFWAYSDTNWCPSGGSGANVLLHVTDAGGTSLATVWDMCDDVSWSSATYRQVTVSLPAYAGQTIKMAWQYVGINGQSFGLDDVLLTGTGGTPAVLLEPAYQKKLGQPGAAIQYGVTLRNLTNQADSFDITYTGATWNVSGPTSVGPVANNGSAEFQVIVTIASGAECPNCDTVTIKAQAQASPAVSNTVTIDTCAGDPWQTETTAPQGAHWMAYTCTDQVGSQGTCFYFGGLGPGNTVTGYAQKYDIASGAWTRLRTMTTPVFGAVAGYVDGKVYVAGGFTNTSWAPTGKLQIYNPTTNLWSTGADMPTPRGGLVGGAVGSSLYAAGGEDQTYGYRYLHEYDPATDTWTEKAAVPDFLAFGAGAASSDHLYVGGGYSGENGFFEYDPEADTWETRANLPDGAGKKSPVMATVPECDGVFLYGGDLGDWAEIQDTTWYWDSISNAWIDYGAVLNQPASDAGGGYAHGTLWSFAGSAGSGPISVPPHESLAYCCPASPATGFIAGQVTDANTGEPLESANVYLTGVTDPGFEDSTWTNALGTFSLGPLVVADYTIRAAEYGYYNGNAAVTVPEGATLTQDFVLDAAVPELSPRAVGLNVPADSTGVLTLTLENHGTGSLGFHISELPADMLSDLLDLGTGGLSGVDPQVYADLSESADGTASFVVYMAEQADLSEAFAIKDRSARGYYVMNALRATAERTQAGLRGQLGGSGVEYTPHYILNAVVVKGNVGLLESLTPRPEVAYIAANSAIPVPKPVQVQPAPEGTETIRWNIQKIRADQVWSDPGFGTQGEGITVANIDTGVNYTHPALVGQYRGNQGGGSFDHNYNWWDPYGYGPSVPYDFQGHGTHTMGTMAGDDGGSNQIGVAPGANWFTCEGFDKNTGFGYEAELLECAEFILAPWDLNGANPDPDLRADVVNNSWGGGQAQWWYSQIVYAWRAAGIFPSFSMGNDGPDCDTAGDPGDMPNIMGVGATNSSDSNAPGTTASFSSRGPAEISGLAKPNVSAPGAGVYSSLPGSSYGSWDGTSMASPHVAGEAALIWAAQPDLRGNVQLTYRIIEQSAVPLNINQGYYCGTDDANSVPNNQYGWGRIDAYEAVSMAVHANWDVSWLAVGPVSGTVSSMDSESIELAFDTTGLTSGQCYNSHLKVEYNDPYVVEEFVPVALCVDLCLKLDDVTISGPQWLFVDREGEYQAVLDPVTATLPITIEWSSGATETATTFGWPVTGSHSIIVTATNCDGSHVVTDLLEVTVKPLHTLYLPLIFKAY